MPNLSTRFPRALVVMRASSRFALLLAALLTFFSATPRALAQGTSGQLPDPISSQDLSRFLERYVHPSPDQWDAIEVVHEQYKTDFTKLREGEIERFLVESRKMQSGGMPKRKDVEEFLRENRRLLGRIKSLDTQLFDQIQTAFEDAQVMAMPRVRLARERQTYRNPMMMGGMGQSTDLSDLLSGLELPPEQWSALDPVLIPYEQTLTRKLGESFEATTTMMMSMFDALESKGFGEMSETEMTSDPEKMRAVMEVVQQTFAESGKKTRDIGYDMLQLNHRTRKSVEERIPPELARKFRRDFVVKAYPGLPGADGNGERILKAALRLKGLDADQKSALELTWQNFVRDDGKIEDEFMKDQDEQTRDSSPLDMMTMDWQKRQEEMAEKAGRRVAVAHSAIENAKGIVGPELAAKLDKLDTPEHDEKAFLPEGGAEALADEGEMPGDDSLQAAMHGGDLFLPPPIGVDSIANWTRRLALDGDSKDILTSLHSDYLEQWNSTVQPRMDEVSTAQMKAYGDTEGGDPKAMLVAREAATDAMFNARLAAITEAERVDALFVENVQEVLLTEDSKKRRAKLLGLERTIHTGSSSLGWAGFEENREGSINIVAILVDAAEEHCLDPVESVLLENADALRSSAKELRALSMENQRLNEKFGLRMQLERGDDGDFAGVAAAATEYQNSMKPTVERLKAATAKQRDIVRKVLDECCAKVSESDGKMLRRSYKRDAFPQVYADQRSAERYLERARDIDELTDAQRGELERLNGEFEPAYEAFSDRMVEVSRGGTSMTLGMEQEQWREWQERREKSQKIRFERDELCVKTVRKVRQILGDDLAKKVPGLLSYGQNDPEQNPFFNF